MKLLQAVHWFPEVYYTNSRYWISTRLYCGREASKQTISSECIYEPEKHYKIITERPGTPSTRFLQSPWDYMRTVFCVSPRDLTLRLLVWWILRSTQWTRGYGVYWLGKDLMYENENISLPQYPTTSTRCTLTRSASPFCHLDTPSSPTGVDSHVVVPNIESNHSDK